jgi:FkbM family methyltransferase
VRLRRDGRAAREQFWHAAGVETELVSVQVDGLTFLVSTRDESVGRKLFVGGVRSEFEILRRAVARVGARGAFLDVGANIGTATLPALAHFDRAICVEAEPLNASLLQANLALNGLLLRAVVHQAACSSEAGELMLRLAVRKHGGHAIRSVKPGVPSIAVEAVTIDGVVAAAGLRPEDVGLVWMDVEGYEHHALAGGKAVLATGVPLVVEVRGGTAGDVVALLERRYDRFVDLRNEQREGSLSELPGYLGGLNDSVGRSFTDVLVT